VWQSYINAFKNYLKLERSLAENSVEAYLHDISKLHEFLALSGQTVSPMLVTEELIFDFLAYLTDLGLSAHSQARILSGLKAFYKFLLLENEIQPIRRN
jgi:integrase/recombinase XerD